MRLGSPRDTHTGGTISFEPIALRLREQAAMAAMFTAAKMRHFINSRS
jgi:hypothetical protein